MSLEEKKKSLQAVVAMAMHNYLLALQSLMCGNYVHNRFRNLFLLHYYCQLCYCSSASVLLNTFFASVVTFSGFL